jgi:hypothetical protein
MQPTHSFPPGSGWTVRHWAQAICAGVIAGTAAAAMYFPQSAAACHVIQAFTDALFLQLALTTNSIATERRQERADRITPWDPLGKS